MEFLIPIVAFLTAYLLGVLIFPLFIKLMNRWKLLDEPDHRKIHEKVTPSYGGLIIFSTYAFSVLLWTGAEAWAYLKFLLLGQTIMVLFGLRDDWEPLKPYQKFAGQVIAATIIITMMDFRICGLYGLVDVEMPKWLSYVISAIIVAGITNGFNLIDGVDGLAGGVACMIFCVAGIWLALIGQPTMAILCFGLFGSIVAFLHFNWQPAKIFMGDTGSLFLGLSAAGIIINVMNLNQDLPSASPYKFQNIITVAIAILAYPIFDMIRVIILRIKDGLSPFHADRRHVHHFLLDRGNDHQRSVLLILAVNILIILVSLFFRNVSDSLSLIALLALLAGINFLMYRARTSAVVKQSAK